jgi:hypothetical protein
MKALISPNELVTDVLSWNETTIPPTPNFSLILNACKVCQKENDENIFPVAKPLFWVDCNDGIMPSLSYYDLETKQILPKVNAKPSL